MSLHSTSPSTRGTRSTAEPRARRNRAPAVTSGRGRLGRLVSDTLWTRGDDGQIRTGQAPDIPRQCRGRRQDLRHALRGAPPRRAGHRCGRRFRGDARAPADRRVIEGLEVVPRAELPYRGTTFEEMDLVAVIVVALVGGFVPAVLLAVASSLLLNFYFTPPIHQWTIAEANNALALGVFVVVALLVSSVVDIAARRTRQAARAGAESALLATTAVSVLRGQRAVEAVLDRVREAFGMDSVTLLERADDGGTPVGPATA